MKQLTVIMPGNAIIILFLSCQSVDTSKNYLNMIANADLFPVGTVKARFDHFFLIKTDKTRIEAVIQPLLSAVLLKFKYELVKYRQFRADAEAADSAPKNLSHTYGER